jgi:ribosomal protein L17
MFQKGQSGNPAGPAKGTRHKITMLAEKLMAVDAENIVAAVVTAARNGDMAAAKIILDRIAPVSRRQCVSFDLPKIESLDDEVAARGVVLSAVADGDLTPGEAAVISELIDELGRRFRKAKFGSRNQFGLGVLP